MKYIFTMLLLGITAKGFAQWQVVPGIVPQDLHDISFAGGQTIMLGADQGVIYSFDNGAHWDYKAFNDGFSDFALQINGVHLTDAQTGVVSGFFYFGNSQIIFRSTDGFQNWTDVHVENDGAWPHIVRAFAFPTTQLGFGVGHSHSVLKTTDGGGAWSVVEDVAPELRAISMFNSSRGIAAGDQVVLNTSDGGATWSQKTTTWAMSAVAMGSASVVYGGGGCSQTAYDFINTAAMPPNYTFQWWLDDALVSTDFNTTLTFPEPGTHYEVMLVVNNGVLADTARQDFQTLSAFHFAVDELTLAPAQVCAGYYATLHYDSAWVWTTYQLWKNGVLVYSNWQGAPSLSIEQQFGNDPVEYVIKATFFDGCIYTPFADTLLVVPVQNADAPQVTTDKTVLCPGDTTAIHVSPTQVGNFYLVGRLDTFAPNVSEVGFVRKINADNQVLWQKRFIPNYPDEYEAGGSVRCRIVATDPLTGNIWVSGELLSKYLKIDNFTFSFPDNHLRSFLAKIQPDGHVLWVNVLDNYFGAGPNDILYAGPDHLYLVQYGYSGSIKRSGGQPSQTWGASVFAEAWFLRFDESGKMVEDQPFSTPGFSFMCLWHRPTYEGLLPSYRGAPALRLTPQGRLLFYGAAGWQVHVGNFTIDPIPGSESGMTGFFAVWDTAQRIWLSVFPAFGVPSDGFNIPEWDETMFSPSFDADEEGNILLAFSQPPWSTIGNEPYTTLLLPDGSTVAGEKHSFLMKFNQSGERLWMNLGTSHRTAGLDVLPDGGIAVASNFEGFAGLSMQDGVRLGFPSLGSQDWMVSVWDAQGNLQYARDFGTAQFDMVYLMRSQGCGRFLVLHSVDAPVDLVIESVPRVAIFSPDGDCSGTPTGCTVSSYAPAADLLSMKVYPDPTSGQLTLEWSGDDLKDGILQIIGLHGQTSRMLRMPSGVTRLDVEVGDLPAGIYFVKVLTEGRPVKVLKFTKA